PTTFAAQALPALALDADGDAVVVWQSYRQDGSGYGIYAQRYDEPGDHTGPTVARVAPAGAPAAIAPGGRVAAAVPALEVTFSEAMAAGVTGAANWRLTRNGQDVSARIGPITYGLDAATNQYRATRSEEHT